MSRVLLTLHATAIRRHLTTVDQFRRYASELLSDGERLELRDEPGRAMSESEAVEAIREGRVVEVVS